MAPTALYCLATVFWPPLKAPRPLYRSIDPLAASAMIQQATALLRRRQGRGKLIMPLTAAGHCSNILMFYDTPLHFPCKR